MISSNQMKALEEKAEAEGISKLTLMENAGKGIADVIEKKAKNKLAGKKILVICYHGNNGGDGFVAARYLLPLCKINVLFLGDEEKLKPEAKHNYEKLKALHRDVFITFDKIKSFEDYDIIIDAIFGTGFIGGIQPELREVIDAVNESSAYVVSVDMPTGIDCDTGRKSEAWIEADLIITFHDKKKGMIDLGEEIIVVDIGIPRE